MIYGSAIYLNKVELPTNYGTSALSFFLLGFLPQYPEGGCPKICSLSFPIIRTVRFLIAFPLAKKRKWVRICYFCHWSVQFHLYSVCF